MSGYHNLTKFYECKTDFTRDDNSQAEGIVALILATFYFFQTIYSISIICRIIKLQKKLKIAMPLILVCFGLAFTQACFLYWMDPVYKLSTLANYIYGKDFLFNLQSYMCLNYTANNILTFLFSLYSFQWISFSIQFERTKNKILLKKVIKVVMACNVVIYICGMLLRIFLSHKERTIATISIIASAM